MRNQNGARTAIKALTLSVTTFFAFSSANPVARTGAPQAQK